MPKCPYYKKRFVYLFQKMLLHVHCTFDVWSGHISKLVGSSTNWKVYIMYTRYELCDQIKAGYPYTFLFNHIKNIFCGWQGILHVVTCNLVFRLLFCLLSMLETATNFYISFKSVNTNTSYLICAHTKQNQESKHFPMNI